MLMKEKPGNLSGKKLC